MLTILSKCLAILPLSIVHRLGAAIGWLIVRCSPSTSKCMRANLMQSGLATNPAHLNQLLRANIAETGKALLESLALWQWSQAKVQAHVTQFNNWQVVNQALAKGKGILFLTPHLGCFEITSRYYGITHPITVLFRPPKKSWLTPLVDSGRRQGQVNLAPANVQGVRSLLQALKRGEAIGILPDQIPAEGEGDWADFFGKPAYTMTLASRLVERTGATVIMAFGERLAQGQGYQIHLTLLPDGSIRSLAGLNHAIEQQIAQCPTQYLWHYNRYKVRRRSKEPNLLA